MIQLKPTYFNKDTDPLFGIYHKPQTDYLKKTGIICCYPFGQEYIRSHKSFKQLAERLSRAGYHVLRFDYFGTGDSYGDEEEITISQWKNDIRAAIQHIKKSGDIQNIALIGLRLGGTLAFLVGRENPEIIGIALWDPVISGSQYYQELKERHEYWLEDMLNFFDRKELNLQENEILGFHLNSKLIQELREINLLDVKYKIQKKILFITTEHNSSNQQFVNHLTHLEASYNYEEITGIKPWIKYEGLDKSLVPFEVLTSIENWIMGTCQ